MDAANPASVAEALHTLGYRARQTTEADGDPMIESGTRRRTFSIPFYGCIDNTDCQALR